MLLYCGKAVCDCAYAGALDVVRVIAWSSVVIVFAFLYAVPYNHRKESSCHLSCVLVAQVVVYFDLCLYCVIELFIKCSIEIFKGSELTDVACLDADLLACQHVDSVCKYVLKKLGNIEVSMEQICLFASRSCLDASACAAFARIFKCLAYAHLFLNDHVGVEDRRITHAVAENPCRSTDNAVRGALADLDVALGLQEAKFVKDLEADICHFARSVSAVSLKSGQVDVREVVVGPAFGCSYTDLGRCGGVVDLDPEAGEEFFRRFSVKCSGFYTLLIERGEVLVKMTGAHSVPAVEFRYCAKVHEPIHLDRFPEVSRRVCGYPSADIGYLEKFCLAFGIALTGRHLFGKLGMSFSEDDDCIAGDIHTLELFVFCCGFGIFQVVQLCTCFGYLFF